MEQVLDIKAQAAFYLEHRADTGYVFMELVQEIDRAERRAKSREVELEIAKQVAAQGEYYPVTPEFNPRAYLYFLTELAEPEVRRDNPQAIIDWIKPQPGQRVVDVGSGPGIISRALAKLGCRVYAVDASDEQLEFQRIAIEMDIIKARQEGQRLPRNYRRLIRPICQDFSRPLPIRTRVDSFTSYGCIHHLGTGPHIDNRFRLSRRFFHFQNDQATLFREAARLLREGGVFGAADIGKDTPLERYFQEEVKTHCLTGHEAIVLDVETIKNYCVGQPLEFVRAEVIDRPWGPFVHPLAIPMYFMGLHGYSHKIDKMIEGLQKHLGLTQRADGYYVNWPMLFFEVRRTHGNPA